MTSRDDHVTTSRESNTTSSNGDGDGVLKDSTSSGRSDDVHRHQKPLRLFDFVAKTSVDADEDLRRVRSVRGAGCIGGGGVGIVSDGSGIGDYIGNESRRPRLQLTALTPSRTTASTSRSSSDREIWNRKAPDFSPRLYDPKPPKRNSSDAIQPWKYAAAAAEAAASRAVAVERESPNSATKNGVGFSSDLRLPVKRLPWTYEATGEFLTRFKELEPHEARILFVRNGVYPKPPYISPKPHDFRQVLN